MTPRRRKPTPGGPRALAPELVAIGKLRADPNNLRRHPEKNLAAIKASLAEHGQIKPIVVSKNLTIAAGNGTYEAAVALGWDFLGVIVFPGTPAQARRYAIQDNRTGELAEWDEIALLDELRATPLDLLDDLGFTADDTETLAAILDRSGTPVEFTAAPEKRNVCPRCGHQWTGSAKPSDT